MTFEDEHARRVELIWQVLINATRPLSQAQVARMASRVKTPITAAHVRALTPLLEQKAKAAGVFLNRPTYGVYRYSLSRQPWGAARSMIQRWRHVLSRVRNDAERGAMLEALTTCGDREVERLAQRTVDAYNALIDADNRVRETLDVLVLRLDSILTGGE